MTYQWRKDGTNITGATQSIYTIASVLQSHAGTYSARITNSSGYAISSNAILTVIPRLTAISRSVTTPEDTATNLVLTSMNATGPGVSYAILVGPTNGLLGPLDPNTGAVTYTPVTNYNGNDSFRFTAFDGNDYATGSVTLTITMVRDVPTVMMPLVAAGTEDIPITFSAANGNAVSAYAPDSAANPIELTLTAANGTATLSGLTGLTFSSGDGAGDATMTLRGPLLYLNAALNGLAFTPATNFNGSASLTIKAVDDGLTALNWDSGLLGHYTFDDPGSATTLGQDSSPAGANDAKTITATTAVNAARGNVLQFSSGQNVKFNGRFGNPTNVTLAAWVNLTSTGTYGGEVVSLGDSAALRVDDLGKLKGFIYNGSNWKEITYSVTLVGSGWHHVALTFDDAANRQKLYLDGVQVANRGESSSISYALGANAYLGIHGNGETGHNFVGFMDDVRVYNRALADTEIAVLATDLSLSTTNSTTLNFAPANDPPLAVNDTFTTQEDTPLVVSGPGLLGNAADADGDAMTAVLVSSVARGSLALNGDGSFTYTPATDDNGSVSFTYAATDGLSTGNVAIVTINITPVNDGPIAPNQNLTTPEDLALAITLTSYDPDGPVTNFAIVTLPANGTLTGSGANRTYTPNTNFFGADSFTFKVNDGLTNSAAATVSISVTPMAPQITSQPQSKFVMAGESVLFNVVATGSGPLSYQWSRNSTPLPGATAATFSLNTVQSADAGDYAVMVANAAGSIPSSPATLSVSNPPISLSVSGTTAMTSNGFSFQLSVPAGCTYVILASINCLDWTPIATHVASATEVLFTDPNTASYSRRFYRAFLQ